MSTVDPRTRLLLEAPIGRTLLRLAVPNVIVMVAQAAVGLIETYFVGKLGTDALAGMALVFPIVMLMQMTSAGAMGGGIASAIARALGGGRRADADALVLHAVVVALGFGAVFTLALLLGGRWLYTLMGGTGASLEAALAYSHWVFAGAVLVWLFNSLAAVIRGTGNMTVPANVTVAGVVLLIPLSPLLIFGWGPMPGLGIAGGAIALLLYYLLGTLALLAYLRSPRSLLKVSLTGVTLRWPLFRDILRVGLLGAVSTVATNLAIGIATALAGQFGPSAIAGYGTASRLEYLLVPLVFGFGAPLLAMVGTCIGAGQRERALRATWVGAAMAFGLTEAIGLAAALFPRPWLLLFGNDPAMLEAGTHYLHAVGPFYGFFGVGLVLYFASQGAGRLYWPVVGNLARLVVAGLGGWLALRWSGNLTSVFVAQGVALVVYGTVIASAIAGGAWFGRVGWPRTPRALMQRFRSA
ncbi:MATE family efflux transporter [Variovorax guangxiensis]|uniref:MATE family efflux transporter n=1 Tax=Variovorax guangxiensis TaxID=1775474 RepID=A0A502DWR4_9BURK|nr:MATE family efflux transporter [Variovorax guangxiensis]RZI65167.1 MAG: MATE family efflux transporter [Variovorax sp.]TPG26253.1 MATE family efflux transporter [Variovorax ginsengisoli]TPG29978.1 MATE family efflux transporter [Variovorax guangxiensis]